MPGTQSVQLPDLLSLSRAFELRTNRHCHAVTTASEKCLTSEQHHVLTEAERAALRPMKIGLWASVCFPTCDPPQLRLATDFLTALVVCNARLASARPLRACGWTGDRPASLACLSENDLFHDVVSKITACASSEPWGDRFSKSSEAYRDAQLKLLSHRQNNTFPGVEAYVELRRDLSGMPIVFDLIEMAEGLKLPAVDEVWKSLKSSAADVVALSTDIFAFNNDQFNDNEFNIVSIIRAEKGVAVQGAINCAFALVERAFQTFAAAEAALQPVQVQSPGPGPSAWTWNPLSRKQQPSEETPSQPTLSSDSKLYLRGLKDCIVGTLNWSYETELYFGSKGDEVRQFGWVFLRVREGE
ncbi:isoprenoid synthase domain-containing protein [Mycena galericulata]|nr:isoprenoid synthase domain-containing protein [Mycena galericulata]